MSTPDSAPFDADAWRELLRMPTATPGLVARKVAEAVKTHDHATLAAALDAGVLERADIAAEATTAALRLLDTLDEPEWLALFPSGERPRQAGNAARAMLASNHQPAWDLAATWFDQFSSAHPPSRAAVLSRCLVGALSAGLLAKSAFLFARGAKLLQTLPRADGTGRGLSALSRLLIEAGRYGRAELRLAELSSLVGDADFSTIDAAIGRQLALSGAAIAADPRAAAAIPESALAVISMLQTETNWAFGVGRRLVLEWIAERMPAHYGAPYHALWHEAAQVQKRWADICNGRADTDESRCAKTNGSDLLRATAHLIRFGARPCGTLDEQRRAWSALLYRQACWTSMNESLPEIPFVHHVIMSDTGATTSIALLRHALAAGALDIDRCDAGRPLLHSLLLHTARADQEKALGCIELLVEAGASLELAGHCQMNALELAHSLELHTCLQAMLGCRARKAMQNVLLPGRTPAST